MILLRPATQRASLTRPSSDCIYETLCLLGNEPTLFKVEVHSIDPGLTVLFSSGSTENTIYIPWRNLWCGVTSQLIGECGISSAGWLKKILLLGAHKKGRGKPEKLKTISNSVVVPKSAWDLFWVKVEFLATACFQGLHYTFQTLAERWFKLAYMQGSIQKNPQNSHDYCDEPPWKMLLETTL